MNLILCHATADFDALGAAVGLCVLHPGSRIVLTGGCHPTVRDFLALHRDEYPLIERRAVNPKQIRSIMVVDTSDRVRLGKAADWLDLPHLEGVIVYDHHPNTPLNIPATEKYIESVGATTTLIVEKLRRSTHREGDSLISLTPAEATAMALGIHVDTGSLTFDHTTARDAYALAWLMEQGASLGVMAEYLTPALSPQLQDLLTVCLDNLQSETLRGYTISWVLLNTDAFVPGLSSLASRLIDFTDADALFLANVYKTKESGETEVNLEVNSLGKNSTEKALVSNRLTMIGRSRIAETNLNELFQKFGGGGHDRAAAASLKNVDPLVILSQLVEQLKSQIPHPPIARELMSSPVRTIRPETLVSDAHRILLRYGHSGLSVVDDRDNLVGIITRRDIDIALHHGFSHAPVKGYMTPQLKTITPDTTLTEIESLMVTYDIGRLPVLTNNQLVGIVTRTDVLRELHQQKERGKLGERLDSKKELIYCPLPQSIEQLLAKNVTPELRQFLSTAAEIAEAREWQLYIVGGAVRDLLLTDGNAKNSLSLTDIDLVVDCCQDLTLENVDESQNISVIQDEINQLENTPNKKVIKNCQSPAVELALALQKIYPDARLDIHGQFQTAALLWHKNREVGAKDSDNKSQLSSNNLSTGMLRPQEILMVDIATARTEFYPYPAANPEVEASSIRQDLYRRDFTINALAVRLSNPRAGELLDFFGGLQDLTDGKIRVLHANSFIEDPTRIYRAVRFAVRLGFEIEPQTEGYIRHAIESGIYDKIQGENGRAPALETRLKSELKYILQALYWKSALQKLGNLGALRCIHPSLDLDRQLWWQLRLHDRCLHRLSMIDAATFKSKFAGLNCGEDWQMRLEVLIAYLAPDYRGKVAANLQLSADSVQLLTELEEKKIEVVAALSSCERLSQLVLLLRNYELRMLILLAVQCPRRIRRKIWEYLTRWVSFEPLLNGNDLKVLGYRPGPQFKRMLDDLLVATLDGEVRDKDGAIAFLGLRY
ncbi:poly(A) polymerase [Oscillatoriales cyanobacterium USR001]|nr:poly(A) polymerase [Oscillatoriales cyanobacterium USR001]